MKLKTQITTLIDSLVIACLIAKILICYIYTCGNLRCVGLLGNSQTCLVTFSAVLGMLRNVLGMLCNVLSMLGNVLGVLGMPFCKVLGVPHRRKTPPTCYLINCEAKKVVYHQVSYKAAQKTASGGVFLRCGIPRTLRKDMPRTPRTLRSMPRS